MLSPATKHSRPGRRPSAGITPLGFQVLPLVVATANATQK